MQPGFFGNPKDPDPTGSKRASDTSMNHRAGLWLMVCQVKRIGKGDEMMVAKGLQRMCKRDAEGLLAASGLRLLLVRLLLFLATTMLPHLTAHHRQYLFPQLRPATSALLFQRRVSW
jgi:hypothetical protein